jgi:hypothetical protein
MRTFWFAPIFTIQLLRTHDRERSVWRDVDFLKENGHANAFLVAGDYSQ